MLYGKYAGDVMNVKMAAEEAQEDGIGHHGEPGIEIQDLKSAQEMADMSLDIVLPDLPFDSRDEKINTA